MGSRVPRMARHQRENQVAGLDRDSDINCFDHCHRRRQQAGGQPGSGLAAALDDQDGAARLLMLLFDKELSMRSPVRLCWALSCVLTMHACAHADMTIEQNAHPQQERVCLKNSLVEVYIDPSSLTLLDIYDPINNISYVREPGNSLFCITFTKSAKELYETDRFVSISGDQAKDESFTISDTPYSTLLSLHYNNCPTDLTGHSLNVTVELELKNRRSIIYWNLKIDGSPSFGVRRSGTPRNMN